MRTTRSLVSIGLLTIGFALAFDGRAAADEATADKNWFAFEPVNDVGPSAIGLEDWIEAPAGKRGPVKMVGDHFEFADGTRVKFWGVNNGNGNFQAPDDGSSPAAAFERAAKHYRKYGVNCVRMHKFAENQWGVFGDSVLEFVPEKMDRFDQYLHQMKKHGVYFGFSHVFHLQVPEGDRDRLADYDEIKKIGSTTGMKFARDIQDLHIAQTVALLNHKNPFTGLRYADDPALAFVEMHNEDNLYWPIVQERVNRTTTYKRIFCEMFSAWLKAKYGLHKRLADAWGEEAIGAFPKFVEDEHLDRRNIYPLANCFSILWELENRPALRRRMLDTAQFLYETQVDFYRRYEMAIRDTGYRGPLVGSCWQAGHGITHYGNLHSDYLVGIIDRHNYWGNRPDKGLGQSMLAEPGSGLLGTGLQHVADRPFAFSEWISVFPNEWAAEGPPIIAAYGMGLQGWDASYEFFSGHPGFSETLGRTWNVQQPSQIGLYPALARMVYRGDVKEAPVVSKRNVHMPSFQKSDDPGFDERVIQDGDYKVFTGGFQPAMAVGRTVVDFVDEPATTESFDPSPHRDGDTLHSITKQLAWTSAGDRGYFTIDTPGTKGVIGFARKEPFDLSPVTITPDNLFAIILVSATEPDSAIADSRSLLITVMARSKNSGMRFDEAGVKVVDRGHAPILLEPVRAKIHIERQEKSIVHILDHDGRRTGRALSPSAGLFTIDGARDKAFYYEVVYP